MNCDISTKGSIIFIKPLKTSYWGLQSAQFINVLSKWKKKFQPELTWINLDKVIVFGQETMNHASDDL